jgi:hypothetical protein
MLPHSSVFVLSVGRRPAERRAIRRWIGRQRPTHGTATGPDGRRRRSSHEEYTRSSRPASVAVIGRELTVFLGKYTENGFEKNARPQLQQQLIATRKCTERIQVPVSHE